MSVICTWFDHRFAVLLMLLLGLDLVKYGWSAIPPRYAGEPPSAPSRGRIAYPLST